MSARAQPVAPMDRQPRAALRRGRRIAADLPRAVKRHGADEPRPRLAGIDHLLRNAALVERLARTFRALGDPTRSKMVLALSIGELCVTDLARALGASLSATSHQLRILRDLDIVRVRRSGRSQLYALNEQAFGLCMPRVCHAWKQTLDGEASAPPLGSGRPPSRGPTTTPGRPSARTHSPAPARRAGRR